MLKYVGEYCEAGDASYHSYSDDAGLYVLKQHCRTAFDVCGRARMSRGIEKWLPFKAHKNMHIQTAIPNSAKPDTNRSTNPTNPTNPTTKYRV